MTKKSKNKSNKTNAKPDVNNFYTISFLFSILLLAYLFGSYIGRISFKKPTIITTDNARLKTTPIATIFNICNKNYGTLFVPGSDNNGKCKLYFPFSGYKLKGFSFEVPDNWKIQQLGVEGLSLIFTEDKKEMISIQITDGNLSLDNADKATYGFENSPEISLINPNAIRTNRKIENIGNHQVLSLITNDKENIKKRYFILNKYVVDNETYNNIYMITINNDKALDEIARSMISSLEFK